MISITLKVHVLCPVYLPESFDSGSLADAETQNQPRLLRTKAVTTRAGWTRTCCSPTTKRTVMPHFKDVSTHLQAVRSSQNFLLKFRPVRGLAAQADSQLNSVRWWLGPIDTRPGDSRVQPPSLDRSHSSRRKGVHSPSFLYLTIKQASGDTDQ
jgi:hypothetical protein